MVIEHRTATVFYIIVKLLCLYLEYVDSKTLRKEEI